MVVLAPKDLTETFNEQLDETKKYFSELERNIYEKNVAIYGEENGSIIAKMEIYKEFRRLVTDGGKFDIKNNPKSKFYRLSKSFDSNGNAYYNGELWKYDDFGNYNYGVAAKSIGISKIIAEIGGGLNQIYKLIQWKEYGMIIKNWKSYGDFPRDNNMIKRGYNHKFK